jgi:flagellar M-ring protein FliF
MNDTAQLFKDMGPAKVGMMVVVAIAIFGALILMTTRLSKPAVVPLFSGLDSGDSSKIAAKLEGMGVYYELLSGGAQIMVPRDKVLSVRMNLAEQGLPSGRANVGYEIFDKSEGIGVSSFVNNVNLIRALEGELGRTISAFNQIQSARVHLVIPKQDLFSKRKTKPTASIVLGLSGSQNLSSSQITAISHLVATAVPELDVNDITIVDTQGRPFKKGANGANDAGVTASTNEEFRIQYETRVKNIIEDLLSRSVGVGRVEAEVSAEVDFDREVIDSEIYDPDGQVARSVQTVEETESSTDGISGQVTAGNNIPGQEADTGVAGSKSNVARINEITNYEVSKTIKKQIKETGEVRRLSIAVLVDGKYTYDEETEEYIYEERPQDELDKLATLVKSAVGFDETRGDTVEVVNMQFSNEVSNKIKEDKFAWLKQDLANIIQTIVIGLVLTLVILLVVKPMVKRAFEITKNENAEDELQAALAGEDLEELAQITGHEEKAADKESLIDLDSIESKMNQTSLTAINDIVERHPEEVATILRNWIEADNKS